MASFSARFDECQKYFHLRAFLEFASFCHPRALSTYSVLGYPSGHHEKSYGICQRQCQRQVTMYYHLPFFIIPLHSIFHVIHHAVKPCGKPHCRKPIPNASADKSALPLDEAAKGFWEEPKRKVFGKHVSGFPRMPKFRIFVVSGRR